MPFPPRTRGKEMKWKGAERHQIIANLPSEARSIFTPGLAWLLAGLRTCRHGRSKMTGVSTDPSSRFQRKPVVIGCSILLTAAGQSRIRTGFPLGAPRGETPPAIDAQHKGLFSACQSECCGLVKYVRIYVHSPRPLVRIPGAVTMCCAEIKSKANTDSSQVAKSQFRNDIWIIREGMGEPKDRRLGDFAVNDNNAWLSGAGSTGLVQIFPNNTIRLTCRVPRAGRSHCWTLFLRGLVPLCSGAVLRQPNPFLRFALELKQSLRVAGRSAARPDPCIAA